MDRGERTGRHVLRRREQRSQNSQTRRKRGGGVTNGRTSGGGKQPNLLWPGQGGIKKITKANVRAAFKLRIYSWRVAGGSKRGGEKNRKGGIFVKTSVSVRREGGGRKKEADSKSSPDDTGRML